MAALTVGTTAVTVPFPVEPGRSIVVQNLGTSPVYYERSNAVTTSTGVKIEPGGDITLTSVMEGVGQVWLISGTAGQDVRWAAVG